MQNWLDRQLQRNILSYLQPIYPEQINDRNIATALFPDYAFTFDVKVDESLARAMDLEITAGDHLFLKIQKNLHYLNQSGLIDIKFNQTVSYKILNCSINNRGIDFLEDDGGLSAILHVVTVKLHADTIKALILAKIEADNSLNEEEKSSLKEALNTIGQTALTTITEKAIEAIPVAALFAVLQSFIS